MAREILSDSVVIHSDHERKIFGVKWVSPNVHSVGFWVEADGIHWVTYTKSADPEYIHVPVYIDPFKIEDIIKSYGKQFGLDDADEIN